MIISTIDQTVNKLSLRKVLKNCGLKKEILTGWYKDKTTDTKVLAINTTFIQNLFFGTKKTEILIEYKNPNEAKKLYDIITDYLIKNNIPFKIDHGLIN